MNEGTEAITDQGGKCFVGSEEVPCPYEEKQEEQHLEARDLRILPVDFMKNERNDLVFGLILTVVIVLILSLAVLKVKIFSKTLIQYIKPIWLYVVGAILIVLSQYLIALPLNEQFPFLLNITQGLWALMVVLSVMRLSKQENFNFGNAFFLGVIYSIVIHGLKVTIRYLFYDKTLLYIADRFIYGTLLVMLIVVALSPLLVLIKKKGGMRKVLEL